MPVGYRLAGTLMWPFMARPEKGARTSVWAASSPELAEVTAAYFKAERPVETRQTTHDRETAERLWQVTETLVAGTTSP
jgi:hypothetical protein